MAHQRRRLPRDARGQDVEGGDAQARPARGQGQALHAC